ncbi:MAG: YfhO family protein [Lachnospiraceae bacterium]|nr:YfhO family protein [Lachnospiraceae bacterium]
MKEKAEKIFRDDKYNFVWAFLLAALAMTMGMSYCNILPGGFYYGLSGDMFQQYSVFGPHLAEKIREGSNFYYSFNIGMGINTALVWAFYCFSPFDIFYFLLSDAELATAFIVVGKAAASAMFFQLFCKYNLNRNDKFTIIFSLGYGLCSYQLVVLQMSSLTDGLYFLPLVLILVKKLIEEKKMALLTLVYASLFVANFYCGFIVGLSSFGYFCVYFILKKSDKKSVIYSFVRFAFCALTGFLLASFVLIPAAYYVLGMQSNGLEKFDVEIPNPLQTYLCLFAGREYALERPFPYIYSGILMLLIVPFYFRNRKIGKRERVLVLVILLFLTVSMFVMPVYRVLHMFNNPNGYIARYSYVINFILMVIAARQFPSIEKNAVKKMIPYAFLLIGIVGVCTYLEGVLGFGYALKFGPGEFITNSILLGLWIIVLFLYLNKKTKNIMLGMILLSFLEMTFNSYSILSQSDYLNNDILSYRSEQIELLTDTLQEVDSSIYRIDVEFDYYKNNQTVFDYYDIGYFSSAYSNDLRTTMHHLGIYSAGFCLADIGATDFMDMVLGRKYIVTPAFLDGSIAANVRQNSNALSLGYMVAPTVNDIIFEETNVFNNQEMLAYGLTGEHYNLYDKYVGEIGIESTNTEVSFETAENLGGLSVLVGQKTDAEAEEYRTTFLLTGEENRRVLGFLSSGVNEYNWFSAMVQTTQHQEPTMAHRTALETPHIFETDQINDNQYSVDIYMDDTTKDIFVVADMLFCYYNDEVVEEIYADLATNQYAIEVFEDGYVKGTVTATEEKPFLFLTIPYENGWTVLVDGEKADCLALVDNTFLGVELEPGEHVVEFVFEAPMSKIGILCSIIGAVLWLGILIYEKKTFRKGKTEN